MSAISSIMKLRGVERNTHNFEQHPSKDKAVIERHEHLRENCLELANWLVDNIPDSRERAKALTRLEEVMFWGNAGIARILNYVDEVYPEK